MERQANLRRDGRLPWLRPDAKSQVTLRWVSTASRISIDTVVLSTQHSPDIDLGQLREAVIEEVIKPTLPANLIKGDIKFLVNPTGRFVIGGPQGDCGLTGRKIIVDTYGGAAPHGGGAFSGKDPSKVDRSAAYAGRYVAKNIVAAGLASRCLIQVSYAIGVAQPTSVMVNTFGTGRVSDATITKLVQEHFDLRPKGIIQMLDLLRPIYEKSAAYGHFGREEPDFTWEATDKGSGTCRSSRHRTGRRARGISAQFALKNPRRREPGGVFLLPSNTLCRGGMRASTQPRRSGTFACILTAGVGQRSRLASAVRSQRIAWPRMRSAVAYSAAHSATH